MVTPIIALVCFVFAFAANPGKEELRVVPAIEKVVDVKKDDSGLLNKAFVNSTCVDTRLNVIALGEWQSGAQDVVTVPTPSCPPVRLRLDGGRFSQANP
jgi:hypothetical protein